MALYFDKVKQLHFIIHLAFACYLSPGMLFMIHIINIFKISVSKKGVLQWISK
jgi:hypothetical protein